jgi:hypothetical protein
VTTSSAVLRAGVSFALVVLSACGGARDSTGIASDESPRLSTRPQSPIVELGPRIAHYTRTVRATGQTKTGQRDAIVRSARHSTTPVRHRDSSLVAGARRANQQRASAGPYNVEALRTIGLSVPATRSELEARNALPWAVKDTITVRGERMVVVSEGVGNEPAHTTRVLRGDRVELQIEEVWSAGPRAWELQSRRTTMPAIGYEDVVVVTHSGGAPLSGVTEAGSFLTPLENSPPLPFSLQPAVQGAPCDSCGNLRREKNRLAIRALIYDAAAVAICVLTPPPIDIPACIAATAVAADAANDSIFASNAYHACTANPPPCPVTCTPQSDSLSGVGNLPDLGTLDVEPAGSVQDCPPGGPPGNPPGGGGNSGGTTTCYWLIYYDYYTGEILGSQFLGCNYQPTSVPGPRGMAPRIVLAMLMREADAPNGGGVRAVPLAARAMVSARRASQYSTWSPNLEIG